MRSAGSFLLQLSKARRGSQAWGQGPEATAPDPNSSLAQRGETTQNQAPVEQPEGVRSALQVVVWFFKV